jgi:hypothetical protein
VRHAHRARGENLEVLFRRALHGGHRVAAVVTDEVHDVRAMQLAPLAICGVMFAPGEETDKKRQHVDSTSRARQNRRCAPGISQHPCRLDSGRFRAKGRESQPLANLFTRGLLDFHRPQLRTNFVIAALLIAAVSVSRAAPSASAQTQRPIRVFVQTDDTGQADELAARQSSVKDLSEALASKKKSFAIVDNEDNADIEIEILGRGVTIPKIVIGVGGSSSRPGQAPIGGGPARNAELRVKLTMKSNELTADFKNKNKAADNPNGWKSAAGDLADQIEKWVFEHRAPIVNPARD